MADRQLSDGKSTMNQEVARIVFGRMADFSDALLAELDSIFFGASATQVFDTPAARAAFRERWLGSYLKLDKNEVILALTTEDRLAGYLVGSLRDPACDPRHASLTYFRELAPHTCNFPAHLHINVATQHRSMGIGARLIEAFCHHAAARGAPGVHVVTGQGMRNIGFYLRNGFAELAEAPWNGRTVVMLGRRLPVAPP
jgi:ribosomal protein S18 acetylase RimI-like enzyme